MNKQLLNNFRNIINLLYSRDYYIILLDKLDKDILTTDEKMNLWLITLSAMNNNRFVFYNKQHVGLMFAVTKIADIDMYNKTLECLVLKLKTVMDKNRLLNIINDVYKLEQTIIELLSEDMIKECFAKFIHVYVSKYYRL